MTLQITPTEAQALAGQVIVELYTDLMEELDTGEAVDDNDTIQDMAADMGIAELSDDDLDLIVDMIDSATATLSVEWMIETMPGLDPKRFE